MAEQQNLTVDQATEKLEQAISDQVEELLEGAKSDIQTFSRDIARNIVVAVRKGRTDLVDELKDQLGLLAEINRLRAIESAYDTIRIVIDTAASVARRFLMKV